MRYLITGGCGFIGSNLSQEVLKMGGELMVVDSMYRKGSGCNLDLLMKSGNFAFQEVDIRNASKLDWLIQDFSPDIIFHMAGQVAMTSSIQDPRYDFETNALGTLNLLESVRSRTPHAVVIFPSSNKVYGDLDHIKYTEKDSRYISERYKNGFNENLPLNFCTPYGCSKGTADIYMMEYSRMYDLQTVVFRHSSVYGIQQYATYDQGWIGWFVKKAIELKHGNLKEPITISGNGKQVRDLLYIADLVNCYIQASSQIDKVVGQVYNIGGGNENSLSILELFHLLEQKLGIKIDFEQLPWRTNDQKVFITDNSKITNAINWAPSHGINEGIDKMLEWTMTHG